MFFPHKKLKSYYIKVTKSIKSETLEMKKYHTGIATNKIMFSINIFSLDSGPKLNVSKAF